MSTLPTLRVECCRQCGELLQLIRFNYSIHSSELHAALDLSFFCNNDVTKEVTQLIIIIEVEAVTDRESSTYNCTLIVASRLYLE